MIAAPAPATADTAVEPALLAAAFAVADSHELGMRPRRPEPMSIAEAADVLDELAPGALLRELHGRRLGLQVDGGGVVHAVTYDEVNADGLPLFAELRRELCELTPGMWAGIADPEHGATVLAEWARGVQAKAVPGRAWRIEAIDRIPAPARLATLSEEYYLVRCLWVATDQLIRLHDADPVVALKLNTRFVLESFSDPEQRLTAERLFPEVIESVTAALPPFGADPGERTAAWRQLPRQLEQQLPALTLAALSRPAPQESTVHWHFD